MNLAFLAFALVAGPGIVSPANIPANARVLDARDLGSYLGGHVAQSVFLNPETLRYSRAGIPAQPFGNPQLAHIFGQLGISKTTPVVVYSSPSENFANSTLVATMLEALGHEDVSVLDGGSQSANLGDTNFPRVTPQSFVPGQGLRHVVDVDFVRANQTKVNLLDARVTSMYNAGHIPGARSLPIGTLLTPTPARWKSPAEIRALLDATGFDPAKPIVTYCNTGREASMLFWSLRHVAKVPNVRVFLGSMIEWRAAGLPVEKS